VDDEAVKNGSDASKTNIRLRINDDTDVKGSNLFFWETF